LYLEAVSVISFQFNYTCVKITSILNQRAAYLRLHYEIYTGWAKKTGPVWVLITQRRLVVESPVIRQKF